jgi:hypothetical protein
MSDFQRALERLVSDAEFNKAVAKDPTQLSKEYKLKASEMLLLMQAWEASGVPESAWILTICHCCCGL